LIDESFVGTSGEESIVPMLESDPLPNVFVLTSLSKVLGVPGLRLGYLYSHDRLLVDSVGANLPIWNSSSLAEFFLEMLVKFRTALELSVELTRHDMEELASGLRALPEVREVRTGAGGFVLVSLSGDGWDGTAIRRRLLEQHRIDVKDVSRRFDDGVVRLRLAVRGAADNLRLLAALGTVLEEVR
jgi:histidinol-phosphate/aromatic aminotransferase/cobyric acid decarboxylase-like protein